MLRNYLAAALRNLARSRFYAAINIGGLAVGLAAALVAGLFIRSELSFERFLPDYQRIYRISASFGAPGNAPTALEMTPVDLARWLAVKLLPMREIVRLTPDGEHGIRVGAVETLEHVNWADPAFFDVFRLPIVAGNLRTALRRPDGAVLTRSTARRLFGRDDPVGQTLELDRKHLLRVMAVIEDLPSNTHLELGGVIGSSLDPSSTLAVADAHPPGPGDNRAWDSYTYFRLPDAVALDQVRVALREFVETRLQNAGSKGAGARFGLYVYPIRAIHFLPPGLGAMRPRGSIALIYAIAAVGLLILLAAAINFVNLATARAASRQVEVGVRKAVGGARRAIALQFLGEALLYCACGLIAALALVELLLPRFDRIAHWSLTAGSLHQPLILLAAIGFAAGVGLLAGAYPALVLSSFRPAVALRGAAASPGGDPIRRVLVTIQFAVLTGLLIAITVVFQQTSYARRLTDRLDGSSVFVVRDGCSHGTADAFRVLPGVVAAACSESAPLGNVERRGYGEVRPGIKAFYDNEIVGVGFFELYGLRPIAGRLFSDAHGADSALGTPAHREPIVINETAVRKFGFSSPRAAIGQTVSVFGDPDKAPPGEIIGVVPDFPVRSIRAPVEATIFHVDPGSSKLLSVKISAAGQSHALAAIDARWRTLDASRPISRSPVEQVLERIYADIETDGKMFAACSAIALLLACAGIYGLSAFIAERRTKEMGIRKAMGAGRGAILRLMIWQLTKPVLWAQLLAWPIAYLVMHRWLQGFAYHVELGPLVFLGVGAAAVLIACVTVLAQALHVARSRPVAAIRYE